MLAMKTHTRKNRTRLALALALAAMTGCGGVMTFSDANAIAVTGPQAPPPPPPPEAAPKRVEVTADQIVIKEKIQFDFNQATIKPESNSLLDEITGVIKDNPRLKKISIEGHTDSDGSDAYNQKLSQGRAEAVLHYLVDHGIETGRLTARGFGEQKPIASNDTPDGKEKNRRVEFLITEQDTVKQTFEIDPKTGEKKAVEEPAAPAPAKHKHEKAQEKAP
jgi:OOP family OmpA-OmpF porin